MLVSIEMHTFCKTMLTWHIYIIFLNRILYWNGRTIVDVAYLLTNQNHLHTNLSFMWTSIKTVEFGLPNNGKCDCTFTLFAVWTDLKYCLLTCPRLSRSLANGNDVRDVTAQNVAWYLPRSLRPTLAICTVKTNKQNVSWM